MLLNPAGIQEFVYLVTQGIAYARPCAEMCDPCGIGSCAVGTL